jgi:hypothetical protein
MSLVWRLMALFISEVIYVFHKKLGEDGYFEGSSHSIYGISR